MDVVILLRWAIHREYGKSHPNRSIYKPWKVYFNMCIVQCAVCSLKCAPINWIRQRCWLHFDFQSTHACFQCSSIEKVENYFLNLLERMLYLRSIITYSNIQIRYCVYQWSASFHQRHLVRRTESTVAHFSIGQPIRAVANLSNSVYSVLSQWEWPRIFLWSVYFVVNYSTAGFTV